LRQVINNLVKNAIEASARAPDSKVIVHTDLFSSGSGTYVEIRVEDRGDGIDEDLFDTIFEPYVTNKTRGTGLGLAIVKKIVEEHGGIVSLENNAGPGAAAIIRLPIEGVGDTLAVRLGNRNVV
jgi:signal transduction histidine kinase